MLVTEVFDWSENGAVDVTNNAVLRLRALQSARTGAVAGGALSSFRARVTPEEDVTWGVEMELAAKNPKFLQAKRIEVPSAAYAAMLEAVNRALGTDAGPITVTHEPDGSRSAIMTDARGRVWKAVPEYVETGARKNGFELVSPPLTSAEVPLIQSVREELKQDFVPGIRSSMHHTFDVGRMVTPDGDASRLVNLILNIESHWPEIYAAVGPIRYGTTINRFGVPLAVNQRALLDELAALDDRHIDAVKAVFDTYAEREAVLSPAAADRPYKYRAANYSKLFPEPGGPHLLEFRISDLLEPEDIPRVQHLLSTIVRKAGDLSAPGTFTTPFPRAEADLMMAKDPHAAARQLEPLNAAVQTLSTRRYDRFLHRLGLDIAEFPKATSPLDNPLRLDPKEIAATVRAVPRDVPIEVPGGRLSFGFEAEFKPAQRPGQKLTLGTGLGSRQTGHVNSEQFPFINPELHFEKSGNLEAMSNPTELLGEVFQQMRAVKRELGSALRSYHFTIQAPKETVEAIGIPTVEGWLARVGDAAHAWRVQNRSTLFSMKTRTVQRPDPARLKNYGTLRAYPLGNGRYRIELRGYMSQVDEIEKTVLQLVAGLKDPALVRGFRLEQGTLVQGDPEATLKQLLGSLKGAPLSTEELGRLRDMEWEIVTRHVLPLLGFESAPYLTPSERVRFQNATWEFIQDVHKLLARETLSPLRRKERFRELLKTWSTKVELHKVLSSSLLLRPGVQPGPTAYMVSKAARTESPRAMVDWLRELPEGSLTPLLGTLDDAAVQAIDQAISRSARRPTATPDVRAEVQRRGLPLSVLGCW